MKITPNTEVDKAFECGEVNGQEENSSMTTEWRLLDTVTKRAQKQLNMERLTFGHNDQSHERSFPCTWERTETKHPVLPIAKLKEPDARGVLPEGIPCLYFIIGQGILHEKLFQNYQNIISWKERGKQNGIFAVAITGVNCE